VVAEAGRAAPAVERREERGVRERERVRRPVLGFDVADRPELGGARERAEVVRDDAGDVRVDDEHRPRPDEVEGSRDRPSLSVARVVDDLDAELGGQLARRAIPRDEQRPAGRDGRREHVSEHREGKLRPLRRRRIEPSLPAATAERHHDLRHDARL
jgi:hypothetical protein